MNRSKKLYILLGVLVVICIATFIVNRVEEHKEKIKNSDEIILEIASDSVQTLSWKYESNNLAFHKEDKWVYDEDEAFPVNEDKVKELLKLFESFGVAFIIEDVEDYGQYGLDNPICTINLSTQDQSYKITLGNFSNMDQQRYVSIGDGNVYLVKNDPLDYFDAVLSDMIEHDDIPMFNNVSEIQFAGTENYNVVYEEDSPNTYCAEDVYFAQIDGNSLPLDTSRVNSYLKNISYLSPKDYVTYKATDKDLESYGLDSPELIVNVNYTAEDDKGEKYTDNFVLNISRDPEERKAAEKEKNKDKENKVGDNTEDDNITAYVRVGESPIIYKISSANYNKLMAASYDSLRHLEVLSADFVDVTQIDISLEGNEYTITSKKKDDKRTYYYQEEELDITKLQSTIENLKANRFTDEQPTKKEEIRLTIHLDNDNYPEVQVQLYRYDGSYCLSVVDGKPVSLVERNYVVDLIEAVNAIVLN